MRTDAKKRTLIALAAAIGIPIAACSGAQPAGVLERSAAHCEAPRISSALREALCKGNAQSINEALFGYDLKDRDTFLNVLNRLWKGDRSYGKGLPWPSLESVPVRALFVQYLAQGVRNEEIEASLEDMQRFATNMTHGAQRDTDQLEGLYLTGLTDAKEEVPLLRLIALSPDGPALRRRYAIEALGNICAPEAAATLRETEQVFADHDPEIKKTIEKAQQTRERISSSWCRLALPVPR